MNEFNSQQEVWQWLVEGNKCIYDNTYCKFIVGFKNGKLYDFIQQKFIPFEVLNYKEWIKYKEPEYITVNGFQVPKPITEPVEYARVLFYPDLSKHCYYKEITWTNTPFNVFLLQRNILHTNSTAAVIHAKALLGYTE